MIDTNPKLALFCVWRLLLDPHPDDHVFKLSKYNWANPTWIRIQRYL